MAASAASNRSGRKALAEQTLGIVAAGKYMNQSGVTVDLGQAVADAVERTVLYTPSELSDLVASLPPNASPSTAVICVRNCTTLEACFDGAVTHGRRVLALNFASARNPGGGFLSGSGAQEESLARSSALYATQTSERAAVLYETNRRARSCLYSHHMLLAPAVPVFRLDDGALLDKPYALDILTAPAVNAGVVRQREADAQALIERTMRERIDRILAVASTARCDELVLGAYGCGVFGNEPELVAALFADLLATRYAGDTFARVTFAIYASKGQGDVVDMFARALTAAGLALTPPATI